MPTRTGAAHGRESRFHTRETPARESYLLLQHVAGAQIQELAVLLRPVGITPEQYHVLRVLRDAGDAGLPCSAVGERSVRGDPDVTGLLDRLEKQGWVSRAREVRDRRVVSARITPDGLRLLDDLEDSVDALHARQLGSLGVRDAAALRRLLQRLAGAAGSTRVPNGARRDHPETEPRRPRTR